MIDLNDVLTSALTFAKERDWEQFHSPKNLSMALSVESSELLEQFQWLTEAQSGSLNPQQQAAAQDEIADIQVYLCLIAHKLDVDIITAVDQKMKENAKKYPIEKAKGNARKYKDL